MITTIPILRYHSVSTDPAPWIAPYAVAPATFARHVDLISREWPDGDDRLRAVRGIDWSYTAPAPTDRHHLR